MVVSGGHVRLVAGASLAVVTLTAETAIRPTVATDVFTPRRIPASVWEA